MADQDIQTRSRWAGLLARLLRPLAGYLQGVVSALATADINVVGVTAAVVGLSGVGLLAIHYAEAASADGDSRFLFKQGMYVIAALTAMVVVSTVDYRRWGRIAYVLFALTLVVLALLVVDRWISIPGIPEIRNTRRWIDLGPVQLQPSEFAKLSYIMALSWYLRYRTNYRTLSGMLLPLALTLLPMFLILLEPDLGTVMMLLPVFFAMLFVAGARRRHLASLALICVLTAPVLFHAMRDYQRMRLLGPFLQSKALRDHLAECPRLLRVLDISKRQVKLWTTEQGYQLDRSKIALALGGAAGTTDPQVDCMRYDGFLPDRHNDFIFAVVGHKWGWVGCLLTIGCYGVILTGGCNISAATNEPFGKLLAVGAATLIATQALVNIGMAVGLLPVTGMTLPFVSYGGSSLLANGAVMGILLSIGLRRPMMLAPEPFIFEEDQPAAR